MSKLVTYRYTITEKQLIDNSQTAEDMLVERYGKKNLKKYTIVKTENCKCPKCGCTEFSPCYFDGEYYCYGVFCRKCEMPVLDKD